MKRILLNYRYNKEKCEINTLWDKFIWKSSKFTNKKINNINHSLVANEKRMDHTQPKHAKKLHNIALLDTDEWYVKLLLFLYFWLHISKL